MVCTPIQKMNGDEISDVALQHWLTRCNWISVQLQWDEFYLMKRALVQWMAQTSNRE
ncbi:hypothetical protein N9L68_03625 [bacterium]|nr:hypothetical protein [bacterium]